MQIILIGINHKTAPVRVRERMALDAGLVRVALASFQDAYPGAEIVLLSTCNRVECYAVADPAAGVQPDDLARWLTEFRTVEFESIRKYLYIKTNEDAAAHLFTVASSLDSMVIGESQITAQVKESYKLACQCQTVGKVLNRLFHDAFRTAKKIVTETSISHRRVSVAGVAVELAKQLFTDITAARVVIAGAGQMGELLVEHFQQEKCGQITVVNRTRQRACLLAEQHGIRHRPWEDLDRELLEANILVGAATAGDEYLFGKEWIKALMAQRRNRLLLIVDITVPRSFDPEVGKIENVYLYGIDDLAQVAQDNMSLREGDLEQAIEIIYQQVAAFMDWFAKRDVGPVIGQIKAAFEQIRVIELEKFFVGPRQDACCKEMLEQSVGRVVNKLCHCVIKNIDALSKEQGAQEAEKFAHRILANAEQIIAEDKTLLAKRPPESRRILRLVFWESTLQCNLICAPCRRDPGNAAAGVDLNTGQAMQLIDQVGALGMHQGLMPLLAIGGGEPLCRADLFDLIEYAAARQVRCTLVTHGTLIDETIAARLKSAGVGRVSVGLDGAMDACLADRGVSAGPFEAAVNGMRCLGRSGIPYRIDLTVTRSNAPHLDTLFDRVAALGAAVVHLSIPDPSHSGPVWEEMLGGEERAALLDRLARRGRPGGLEIIVTDPASVERRERKPAPVREDCFGRVCTASEPCLGGHPGGRADRSGGERPAHSGVLYVAHNGDAFPGGDLTVSAGSILGAPLERIWVESAGLVTVCHPGPSQTVWDKGGWQSACGGGRALAAVSDLMANESVASSVPAKHNS